MATGAERQAKYDGRRRKELADALAKIKELEARVAVLQDERDRLDSLVGFALKREEWAMAEWRGVESRDVDEETAPAASAIVVVRSPPPSRAPLAHGRTGSPIPPWLMPAP